MGTGRQNLRILRVYAHACLHFQRNVHTRQKTCMCMLAHSKTCTHTHTRACMHMCMNTCSQTVWRVQLTGTLPESWGNFQVLPSLLELNLDHNLLAGELPEEWGYDGAWDDFRELHLSNNNISGVIPESWMCREVQPLSQWLPAAAFLLLENRSPRLAVVVLYSFAAALQGFSTLKVLHLSNNECVPSLSARQHAPSVFIFPCRTNAAMDTSKQL